MPSVQRFATGDGGHRFGLVSVLSGPPPGRARTVSEPGDRWEREADRVADTALSSLDGATGATPAEGVDAPTPEPAGPSAEAPGPAQPAPQGPGPEAEPTAETAPAPSLIVEDDAENVAPGQMRKTPFLDAVRAAVCEAADAELAAAGRSTEGCPYVERAFSYYAGRGASQVERAVRRYAPESQAASSASAYVGAVVSRVRQAVSIWARIGELGGVPEDIPEEALAGEGGAAGSAQGSGSAGAAVAPGGAPRVLFKRRNATAAYSPDPAGIRSQLGSGAPLDAGVRSRMEPVLSHDFSRVRVHADGAAGALASDLDARAFTVGQHVAFGAGEYNPGTVAGDALIAHELAHVIQQEGAAQAPGVASARSDHSMGMGEESWAEDPLEHDADLAAVGAMGSLWARSKDAVARAAHLAGPRLRTGLRLQGCRSKPTNQTPEGVGLGPTDTSKKFCMKPGSFTATTGINQNTTAKAEGRQDIYFEGVNSGTEDGKTCSCDCGLYRHHVRGYYRSGSATDPKHYDVTSCGHALTLDETTFSEEWTSCIGDLDPDPCKWHYADAPGWDVSEGNYIELKEGFRYEVWDRCQGKSVAADGRTVTLSGDKSPRAITWTSP